jgi:hypothetical protein
MEAIVEYADSINFHSPHEEDTIPFRSLHLISILESRSKKQEELNELLLRSHYIQNFLDLDDMINSIQLGTIMIEIIVTFCYREEDGYHARIL